MELFLNLCWLSLVLPAWLLWRRQAGDSARHKLVSVRPFAFFCVLGCALILLFPVISASDDLRAIRTEMEESSPGKRFVSQALAERASISHSRWPAQSGMLPVSFQFSQRPQAQFEHLTVFVSLAHPPALFRAPRAPPAAEYA
jgi:hypothetical protein